MTVVAWFLFIIFILVLLGLFNNGFTVNFSSVLLLLLSAFIVALSAGVIWGGIDILNLLNN
jgi:hypothetical protein